MKSFFVSVILISLNISCFSQEFNSLVDTNKIWSVLRIVTGNGVNKKETKSFILKDEQIIDNKTYFKIYVCNNSQLSEWLPTDTLIRESEKKVYRKTLGSQEELIYDFNLSVGDSIYTYPYQWWFKVLKIDSVMINGENKKRISLGVWPRYITDDIWIETIGSLNDFLNPGYARSFVSYTLLCFRDKETLSTLYHNTTWSQDCYIYHCDFRGRPCGPPVSNQIIEKNRFQIYPNPVFDELKIDSDIENYTITLTDLLGKEIVQNSYSGNISIDCAFLNPGIYVIRMHSKNKDIIEKIIKM